MATASCCSERNSLVSKLRQDKHDKWPTNMGSAVSLQIACGWNFQTPDGRSVTQAVCLDALKPLLLGFSSCLNCTSQVVQVVKNLLASAGAMGLIPGLGDPLKEEMATHSSTLAWRIRWTEEPGGLQSIGSQRVGCDWTINVFTFTKYYYSYSSSSMNI